MNGVYFVTPVYNYVLVCLFVNVVLCSYLLVPSSDSTFIRSSLFSLEHVSTLWSDSRTAGSVSIHDRFL